MQPNDLQLEHFAAPELPDWLAATSPDVLDRAPFGIIGLRPGGAVDFYNAFEQELAGLPAANVMGRDFFIEVAPCTNNFMVRERYMDAWDKGTDLDETIPYVFSYRMKATRVRLRMIVRGQRGWLLVKKT